MSIYHMSEFGAFLQDTKYKSDRSGFLHTDLKSVLTGDWAQPVSLRQASEIARQNARAVIQASQTQELDTYR